MLYTFGYLREATIAHLDMDEDEAQAMHLQERYHIFANEAMVAACGSKPKYDYFNCKIVKHYKPVINLGGNNFRFATKEEIEFNPLNLNFADETDTRLFNNKNNIYLLNTQVSLGDDFIAFAEKQAYVIKNKKQFNPEQFITGRFPQMDPNYKVREKTDKSQFMYTGKNTLTFLEEGEYFIPYKGIWYKFKSGISDEEVIDMPIDIFLTLPLYMAAICLEINNTQAAAIKRAQFERALASCTATDFLDLKSITPSFV